MVFVPSVVSYPPVVEIEVYFHPVSSTSIVSLSSSGSTSTEYSFRIILRSSASNPPKIPCGTSRLSARHFQRTGQSSRHTTIAAMFSCGFLVNHHLVGLSLHAPKPCQLGRSKIFR